MCTLFRLQVSLAADNKHAHTGSRVNTSLRAIHTYVHTSIHTHSYIPYHTRPHHTCIASAMHCPTTIDHHNMHRLSIDSRLTIKRRMCVGQYIDRCPIVLRLTSRVVRLRPVVLHKCTPMLHRGTSMVHRRSTREIEREREREPGKKTNSEIERD